MASNTIIMDRLKLPVFSNKQFGFRSKRPCEVQLLTIMEHWRRLIEDGTSIDAIYLDFQKA